jgi:hypothetical protein
MFRYLFLAAVCAVLLFPVTRAAAEFPVPRETGLLRTYACPLTDQAPVIDGRLDDAAWDAAPWTDEFLDIQGAELPAPRLRTRAKMLWDQDNFYVAASMGEPHVWASLTERDAVIYHDNDFEVFIDPDGDNHLYYELEINALGTEWDLLLIKPYRDGAPAVNAWDIQGLRTGIDIQGTCNDPSDMDSGWSVEIAIPWEVMAQCAGRPAPPEPGHIWRVNFSRVQWRTRIVDGRYEKLTDPKTGKWLPEDNWVWSPQGLIAMHYPERWGELVFLEPGQSTRDAFAGNAEHDAILTAHALMPVYYRQKEFQEKHGRFAADLAELGVAAGTLPLLEPGRAMPLGADHTLTMSGGEDWFHARLVTPVVTATVDHLGRLRRLTP